MDQTAICNLALLRIGIAQQIADITESSTSARACNAVYEQCIRTMLRERPWPFAVRQATLALVGTQVFSDWLYTYRYPSGYLNIHRVNPPQVVSTTPAQVLIDTDRVPPPQSYPYAIGSDASGRLIHSDVTDAVVLGTVYVSDTAQFDPMFSSALAWYIGAEIALSLTKDRELYSNCYNQYQNTVSESFATGMNEQKPRASEDADMVKARE